MQSPIAVRGGFDPLPAFDPRSRVIYSVMAIELALGALGAFALGLSFRSALVPWLWFLVVGAWLARRIGQSTVAGTCETLGLIYSQHVVVLPLLISGAVVSGPLADNALIHADAALGFDWRWLAGIFKNAPVTLYFLTLVYKTFLIQPLVILLWLRGSDRAWQFVSAGTLALLVCALIFPFAPAVGAFAHYGITTADYPNLHTPIPWEFGQDLMAFRGGSKTVDRIAGLIAFPSYHAAAAVMFVWAMWRTRLRYPFLILNIAMVFSALIIGAHYLIDILAGAAVGALAIRCTQGRKTSVYRSRPCNP